MKVLPTLLRTALVITLLLGTAISFPALAENEEDWPREIETGGGDVVIYTPQLDRLEGDVLHARAAVSIHPTGSDEPIFGAAWFEARISTDLDTRVVSMESIKVPRVRFADVAEDKQQDLIELLQREMPTWEMTMSMDRMTALLDIAEKQSVAAGDLNDTPPKIIFRQDPTVLVFIDGDPLIRDLGDSGVKGVVNTPFLIAQDPKGSDFYLSAGADTWYKASSVMGPWQIAKKVPKKIRELEAEEDEADAEGAEEGPSTPPAILVSTEPAELIVTDGPPQYSPIAGSELLVVTNSESDVLREIESNRIYVLLSGRWFSAPSTDGPWEFVPSDTLAKSFANIDPDSDYGYLLTWVAGTEMANDVALDAYVPQTAAIKRDATIQVSYDGEPEFKPVEETTLYHAVNTESQVIKAGAKYYCVDQGVWYVANSAKGPWSVATEVPDEVRAIPPSSPVYNTKYVYIYDSTPEVVYVGYYPGYTSSYYYHGSLVYGTGYYYRPYVSPYHYYPRHSTWGFSVRYNPWYGWSFGLSYSTGRFTFSIGYGGYRGYGGYWGAGGYRGYHRGYNRGWHHGYRSGARAGYNAGYRSAKRDSARNMYNRQGNANRVAHTSQARQARGGAGAAAGKSPAVSSNRANNVYTDKNGNVHRRQQDGSWQQREGGQWKSSDRAGASGAAGAAGATATQRPSSGTSTRQPSSTPSQRPSSGATKGSGSYQGGSSSLNRDYSARQKGNSRASSAPRGGGSRGGGGRGGGGRRGSSQGYY